MLDFLKKLHVQQTNSTAIQFYRYVFVGGLAFVVDFGALYVLTHYAHIFYVLSASISFIIGSVLNYKLSILWIFSDRPIQNRSLEFWFFVGIGLTGLALNAGIIFIFTHFFGLFYLLSKIISAVIVFSWNFGVRKIFLFSSKVAPTVEN